MPKLVVMVATVLVSMVASAVAAEARCPEINGRYHLKQINKENPNSVETIEIAVFSRVVGGVSRYSVFKDDRFYPADGKPHRGMIAEFKATITVRCENGSVLLTARSDDPGDDAYWVRYRPVGPTSIEMTNSDPDTNGIYHKVE